MSDIYRDNAVALAFDDGAPGFAIGAADPYAIAVLREYVRLRSMDHGVDSVCYDVMKQADAMQEYRERTGLTKGPKPAGGWSKRRGVASE